MIPKKSFLIVALSSTIASATIPESCEQITREAHILFQRKEYEQASQKYKELMSSDVKDDPIRMNLGISLFELKKYTEAEQIFKEIIADKPQISAYLYLGKIAQKSKKNAVAIDYFTKAVTLDPTNKDAVYGLTEELKEKLRTQEAIPYLRTAVAHHPNDINLEFTLANTLNMAGNPEEALSIYQKLHKRNPNDAGIIYNIAYTLKKLGRMRECLPYYEKSLSLKPDHTEALFSQGLAYLVIGEWDKGWKGYEQRWTRSEHLRLRTYAQPLWQGEDLKDKTIFVYAEQGLGDTFQFIRYLTLLKERGAYIIFAPQGPLSTLLKLCPYIDELIPFSEQPKMHFDYHIPLVSLPYVMKTTVDTCPTPLPYLYADPDLVEVWRAKLAHDTNIKIGICWQGNSEYNTAFLRAAVAGKSMPVEYFEPLTHIPGVSVYSLQHMTGTDQLKSLPSTMKMITFDSDFDSTHGRFMDTAAVMKNLDLVITIDTSICHLAAALGTPVWNLLPNPPDWRWMLDRTDTPWYPNMELFRQPTPGDWHSSMHTAVARLTEFVAAKRNTPYLHFPLFKKYQDELSNLIQQKQATLDPAMHKYFDQAIQNIQAKMSVLVDVYNEENHA